MFRIGYNTNGLAHHRPVDALRMLADLGYEGVAITPDVGPLDPFDRSTRVVSDVRTWAEDLGLELTIETGARFLLDARQKHFPSLLEEEAPSRRRRIDFLMRCIDLAAELDAKVVSIWAGVAPGGVVGDTEDGHDAVWDRLADGVALLLGEARQKGVQLAFEPEPGMFIERPIGFGKLLERLDGDGDELGLCLDVGHLLVTGDLPVGDQIRQWGPRLMNVHLDDIAEGVHEHRMFGTGDLDLKEALNALIEVGYDGMAAVELSRDSHRGPEAAREALQHITAALGLKS